MKRMLFVVLGALLLGSLLAFAASHWGKLYNTAFETPNFQVDKPLVGQDGWVGLDDSFNAPEIVEGRFIAASGRRAVRCWAGDLKVMAPPYDYLYDGNWFQPVVFDAVTNPARVRVEADVRLVGPDTGEGPGNDLCSANLMARNGSHQSAFFYLSSNGNAYANAFSTTEGDNWYKFETPIKFGQYNSLAITLNYRTHMAAFEVNGKTIGSLPFGGKGEVFKGVLLEAAAWNDKSFDHTKYTAYFDNVAVLTRPAPKNKKPYRARDSDDLPPENRSRSTTRAPAHLSRPPCFY